MKIFQNFINPKNPDVFIGILFLVFLNTNGTNFITNNTILIRIFVQIREKY